MPLLQSLFFEEVKLQKQKWPLDHKTLLPGLLQI